MNDLINTKLKDLKEARINEIEIVKKITFGFDFTDYSLSHWNKLGVEHEGSEGMDLEQGKNMKIVTEWIKKDVEKTLKNMKSDAKVVGVEFESGGYTTNLEFSVTFDKEIDEDEYYKHI